MGGVGGRVAAWVAGSVAESRSSFLSFLKHVSNCLPHILEETLFGIGVRQKQQAKCSHSRPKPICHQQHTTIVNAKKNKLFRFTVGQQQHT